MASIIAEYKRALGERHYIRKATSHNYWVDFTKSVLDRHRSRLGENFCLVINHSDTENDAYVLPYSIMADLLTVKTLDPDGRGWSGTIINNLLRMGGSSIVVTKYFNAYHLLAEPKQGNESFYHSADSLPGTVDKIQRHNIKDIIERYNTQYAGATPEKQLQISEEIARPSLISDYVKQLRDYRCQICNRDGFRQKNGNLYAEAHHIIELHKLHRGSYCSDNIIVVCPNCHRMLHYADVSFLDASGAEVSGSINGTPFTFRRNMLCG